MQTTKHFTVTFEYEDGYINTIDTDMLWFKGMNYAGKRPYYTTVTCNRECSTYVMLPNTPKAVYAASTMLSGEYSFGRVTIKPAWFHKLVHQQKE